MSDSSRDTAKGADWGSAEPGAYRQLLPPHVRRVSWLDPRTLWAARNGAPASWFGDPTGRTRGRRVARRRCTRYPATTTGTRTSVPSYGSSAPTPRRSAPRPRPRPRPKILITGSPLYVDGEHHPCPIDGGGTVDDVVRDPEHHYVAAIGGDIHNYQRCPLRGDSLAFRSHLYARRNWTPPDRGRGRHPAEATP